ncbi:hypothetical protein [Synechococcus sp. CBW1006]|uniref:hypothetical protein n=1 Tax=Synechococcus sp. CBW1006 TaxID=1353138 RepID=UPI0018CC9498|nr:hypothetical protein [Synechococcus sp. CBW1006]QPN67899.1 hypothetical protein H8F26_07220 [Synechococcus sp. CBW1006]
MKIKSLILLAFPASLLITCIITLAKDDKSVSSLEKRELTTRSQLNFSDIKSLFSQLDSFAADQLAFRDELSRTHAAIKINIGDSPSPDVSIGKEGWFFLGSMISKKYPQLFGIKGNDASSKEELVDTLEERSRIYEWLRSKNIKYLLTIAPNKHTIYANYLPDYLASKVKNKKGLELVKHVISSSYDFPYLDLKPPLIDFRPPRIISYSQGLCGHEKAAEEAAEHESLISSIDEIS